MSDCIIICEKPSQAKAIRAAVGARYGEVLPAVGHILTLKEPDDIREDWKTWSAELLWPGKFYDKKVVSNTKQYFDKIKMAAKSVKRIIIATDCDREGQLIGGEIIDFIGFRGEVLRCIFTAEDPKSLQEAFARCRPNEEYHGLYMSGQAREQADQISNLSLTRTATVTLKKPGSKGAIGIGRVKTPVLGIVCKRELEIKNFKPQDMFEIDALTKVAAGQLTLSCSKMPSSLIKEDALTSNNDDEEDELGADEEALIEAESMTGRIIRRDMADVVRQAAEGFAGPLKMRSDKKRQGPPKLFDLTGLQTNASSRFGWSGDKTLKVAQQLYSERNITTYPRGESRHLPIQNIQDIPTLLPALLGLGDYRKHSGLISKPEVRKGKTGHFFETGLAHFAIIPNVNTADQFARIVPQLSEDEAKLFDMIVKQYLAALSPDHEYRQTTIDMTVPCKGHSWDFRASGRIPLVPGWKAIFGAGQKSDDDEAELPEVKDGETGTVISAKLRTVTTKAPARYSEGSLIKVMQEAWRLVDEPVMRLRLKAAKGIGTPATRGDVVKGLFTQGQMVMKGKSIMPTDGGMALYGILARVCPNVVDPARTAMWETIFDLVEKGQMTAEQAVAKILAETQKEIDRIKMSSGDEGIAIGGKSKPTDAMVRLAKSVAERKNIALPRGLASDSAVCKKFLDDNLPKRDPNAPAGVFPPSEKQLEFADRVSREVGKAIPADIRGSSRALSAWIDSVKGGMAARPPSDKQIAYARKLADEKSVDLPEDVKTDMTKCSAFIDKMTGGSKGTASRRAA